MRRSDGQVVQLSPLLYLVAEHADGRRSYGEIAEAVSAAFGRGVSDDNVRVLVEEKLRPLGVLAAEDGSSPKLEKPDPLLSLRFRTAVVDARVVRRVTKPFEALFLPPVILAVLGGLTAFDVWLFGVHGVAQSVRESIYQPALLLLVVALVVASAAFHELGHAAACSYGGAAPGAIGAGIYLAWPAFYTDVTDTYRLNKAGRLRTDLGGVYFNAVFILAIAGVYFATRFQPLLVVVVVAHLEIVHQLLPFVRLDGYYILSDLTGVPDLFSRLKPILKSLVPGSKPEPQVSELKPWARAVATSWVLVVVPLLLFNLAVLVVTTPRILATAWDSAGVQVAKLGEGGLVTALAGVVQLLALALPILGLALTFVRLGRRFGLAAWRSTEGRPVLRGGAVVAGLTAAAFLLFTLVPNGDYEPIGRGERGTVQDYVVAVRQAPTGRSGLAPLDRAQRRGEIVDQRRPFEPSGDVPDATATTTTLGGGAQDGPTTTLSSTTTTARSSTTTTRASTTTTEASTTTTARSTTTTAEASTTTTAPG